MSSAAQSTQEFDTYEFYVEKPKYEWIKYFKGINAFYFTALLIGQFDFKFFLRFHFKNFFREMPEFQIEITNALENPKLLRILIICPRGHGKSTILEAFVIWVAVYNPRWFIMYGACVKDQALERMDAIKGKIETIYPFNLLVPKDNKKPWSRGTLILANDVKIKPAAVNLQLAGSKTEKDERVSVAVLDDICPQEETDTIKDYKVIAWLKRTLFNLGRAGTKIIFSGTPYRETDALSDLRNNKNFDGDIGAKFHYSALNGRPLADLFKDKALDEWVLFPALYSIKDLIVKYYDLGALYFTQQIMCEYISSENSLFPPAKLKFYSRDDKDLVRIRGNYLFVVAGVDLATASGGDWFVKMFLGLTHDYKIEMFYYERDQGVEAPTQKKEIEDLHEIIMPDIWVIESNNYQIALGQFITMESPLIIPLYLHVTTAEKHDLQFGIPRIRSHLDMGRLRFPYHDNCKRAMDNEVFYEMSRHYRDKDGKVKHSSPHNDVMMAYYMAIIGVERYHLFKPKVAKRGMSNKVTDKKEILKLSDRRKLRRKERRKRKRLDN